MEVSARAARLETVSGGLLWSVEPGRLEERNTRVGKDFQSPPAFQRVQLHRKRHQSNSETITWLNGDSTRALPFRCS